MPRATLEPIEEYLLDVEEAGLELPDGLSPEEAYRTAAAAAFFARRKKSVEFLGGPHLLVRDAKMDVDVPLVPLESAGSLARLFAERAPAARARPRRTVLWIDATRAPDAEFAYEHALWGEVTLYTFPTKPRRPRDERVLAAERAGWAPVLKQFNLVPGRGIVVEDGHQGLLVTNEDAAAFAALVVHCRTGEQLWCPNPFVDERFAHSDFQYWLAWAEGTRETEWRRVVDTRED